MISFIIALIALVVGFFVYGKFVERVFGPDGRPTPAVTKADGIDFVVLPNWKIFMIQFLNIAGTGPIFGAIMGAWYGPVGYCWIIFGCIFAGATHDYLSGMLSVRHGGANLPELVGTYLGDNVKKIMLVFTVFLLLMVGVVFVYSPALLLKDYGGSTIMWIIIIFVYYVLATMLPIDKIIGKIYPLFAVALLFMALALLVMLFVKMPALPEFWSDLGGSNLNSPASLLGAESFISKNPLFPCLFITIACGAISGFHATQSPLMARCMKSERHGRPIFYGAMITEGVVALIWATVSAYFFYYGGWREVVDENVVNDFLAQVDAADGKTLVQYFSAPSVVGYVCNGWLGFFGGLLAVCGVVAAPITSGDTAFRSARLIIADALHIDQKRIGKRFYIALPMFLAAIAMLVWQMKNPDGFNTIWQWFGWANQTLSVITLWTLTSYLARQKKLYWLTLVPALFMTAVCSTYVLISNQALGLNATLSYVVGAGITLAFALVFAVWYKKYNNNNK